MLTRVLLVCSFSLLGFACEDKLPATSPTKPSTTKKAGERPPPEKVDLTGLSDVDIRFELHAGGANFDCGSKPVKVGTPSTEVTLGDARLYVSNVRLTTEAGDAQTVVLKPDNAYQQSKVALLDFEDATGGCSPGTPGTHTVLHGAVKPGTYQGLAFVVGVPESVNHGDPALAWPPLDVEAMHWDWTEGYRFLRLEVVTSDDVAIGLHVGSADCDLDKHGDVQCSQENRAAVEFASFDPSSEAVVLDLDALAAGWDLTQDAPDCIAGAEPQACGPMFKSLGLDASGAASAKQQTAFQAVAR